jgi:hypothetical protein
LLPLHKLQHTRRCPRQESHESGVPGARTPRIWDRRAGTGGRHRHDCPGPCRCRLVPLLLSGLRGQSDRPWESGELGPPAFGAVSGLEVPALLRDGWDRHVPDPEDDDQETAELLAPFSRSFPGMAPAASVLASPAGLEQAVASLDEPMRIGLVVASRPADTLVSIGWQGAANYHGTAALLTVVLRSWEDRFGATVMHIGFDTVDLLVERPALSQQAALAVAAEHFAFCMDNIYQGAGSISEYARELTGASRWSFWWD